MLSHREVDLFRIRYLLKRIFFRASMIFSSLEVTSEVMLAMTVDHSDYVRSSVKRFGHRCYPPMLDKQYQYLLKLWQQKGNCLLKVAPKLRTKYQNTSKFFMDVLLWLYGCRWERSCPEENILQMGELSLGKSWLSHPGPVCRPPRWSHAHQTARGPLRRETGTYLFF